jgi:quinol monooxygenase YgiN
MSIRVVAHVKSKPETVDQTRSLLVTLLEPTRAEEGCVTYELMQNTADPTDFTFVEEWTSDAALDGHLETKHLKRAAAMGADLFAAPPDIRRYKLLD